MSKVRVGVSSIIVWVAALAAAAGAAAQVVDDRAPWLAVVAGVLVAVNNVLRSWQANYLPDSSGESEG